MSDDDLLALLEPDRLAAELDPTQAQALIDALRRLEAENRSLQDELPESVDCGGIVGRSDAILGVIEQIDQVAGTEASVLIEGETGTGKTLAAHALHAVGPRAGRKFVHVSCAAFEADTLAGKLFGPTEDDSLPLVEEARGGTLCLEDIEALPQPVQARLLTFINDQGTPAETRIIAVSNLQEQGKTCEDVLRPDLYYRLAAMKVTVPPLRQRGQDILTLFTRLSEQFAEEYGCDAPEVTAQEAAQLLQAPWPGNVRQLINVAERAVLQNRRGTGSISSLLMADNEEMQPVMTTEGKPLKEYVEAFERMLIDNTMRRHKGSIVNVMEELCLPRRTLNEKMAKYGLSRADYL